MAGAQTYIAHGTELLKQGNSLEAIRYLKEATNILPSSDAAHATLAEAYLAVGNKGDARSHLNLALKLCPSNSEIILSCVRTLNLINRQDLSLKLLYENLNLSTPNKEILRAIKSLRQININILSNINMDNHLDHSPSYLEQELTTRTDIINYCIEKYNFEKYLEIGCHDNETFDQIKCRYKVGVDPVQGGTLRMTSDDYFRLSQDKFDIIFIDGLHFCEQVYKDVRSSLKCLNPNGIIVLHDCMPKEEAHQMRNPVDYIWNGDVWKAYVLFRKDLNLDAVVASFDHGVGIIKSRTNTQPITFSTPYQELSWSEYVQNKDTWLRLKTAEELKSWI